MRRNFKSSYGNFAKHAGDETERVRLVWNSIPSQLAKENKKFIFVTIDHADKHLKGLRCSMKPYIDQGWMENIPLSNILSYMNQQLQKERYIP